MKGFKILAAEQRGYFVTDAHSEPGRLETILFAGKLEHCLLFIAEQFGDEDADQTTIEIERSAIAA